MLRRTAAALCVVAALALVAVGGLRLAGVMHLAQGRAALTEGLALERGRERDARLLKAHAALASAANFIPGDAAVWEAMAQLRYTQATAASVETISPELLAAARANADRAAALAPGSPSAPLWAAEITLAAPGDIQAAAAAALVTMSYRKRSESADLALWRASLAFAVWRHLEEPVRALAMREACLAAARSVEERTRLEALAPVAEAAVSADPAAPPVRLPLSCGPASGGAAAAAEAPAPL